MKKTIDSEAQEKILSILDPCFTFVRDKLLELELDNEATEVAAKNILVNVVGNIARWLEHRNDDLCPEKFVRHVFRHSLQFIERTESGSEKYFADNKKEILTSLNGLLNELRKMNKE